MTERQKNKELKILLKKYKKWVGYCYDTKSFAEPVVFLIRQTGRVQFYEGIKDAKFLFKHTNGNERFIMLNRKQMVTFDYGKKDFKGYICHEDLPTALPQEPITTIDEVNGAIEKTLNDVQEWRAKKTRAMGDMWLKIGMAIGLIIGAYALYKMVTSGNTQPVQQAVQNPQMLVQMANQTIVPIVI